MLFTLLYNCPVLFFPRIRTERNGGAWCPKSQVSEAVYEYLEVDLGKVKVISQVETQGRFGNGVVRLGINTNMATVYLFGSPFNYKVTENFN